LLHNRRREKKGSEVLGNVEGEPDRTSKKGILITLSKVLPRRRGTPWGGWDKQQIRREWWVDENLCLGTANTWGEHMLPSQMLNKARNGIVH